jgi:peptide-N4-(N-acetyl-beta-glucosaminyl)asparagine amidase
LELTTFLEKNISTIYNQSIDFYRFQHDRSFQENLLVLKNFSLWFKQSFPYYYDHCYACANRKDNEYFGSVYSIPSEREHLSGRTELYFCGSCRSLSRFPRFNDMRKVIQTHQGRCGEYSLLMMLFLKGLHYSSRYIVDREDHVSHSIMNDFVFFSH